MKEWKIRQKVYHSLNSAEEIGDSLLKETIVEEFDKEKIVCRALEYPASSSKELYYPGKSFCIAVAYAALLEKHFNEPFYEALNDVDLLYGNDPYFQTYSMAQELYDLIIERFPFELIERPENAGPHFYKTIQYFYKEFLLDNEGKSYAPTASK